MALIDPFKERLAFLRGLRPAALRKLSNARLRDVVVQEIPRSRRRMAELARRYPSASARELAQHAIDHKKGLAGLVGGVSGLFGLAGVPADLLVMAYLQIQLLTDVALAHKVDLRFERSRTELLDLLGETNGIGPLQRAGPKVLGKVAGALIERGGFVGLGRTLPLVAAPVTAYLNNHHIQVVGEAAVRHYGGFERARAKARASSGK